MAQEYYCYSINRLAKRLKSMDKRYADVLRTINDNTKHTGKLEADIVNVQDCVRRLERLMAELQESLEESTRVEKASGGEIKQEGHADMGSGPAEYGYNPAQLGALPETESESSGTDTGPGSDSRSTESSTDQPSLSDDDEVISAALVLVTLREARSSADAEIPPAPVEEGSESSADTEIDLASVVVEEEEAESSEVQPNTSEMDNKQTSLVSLKETGTK